MFKDDEQQIIEALKDEDNGTQSMRVIGRGTLVMSARAVRESQKYKDLLDKADSIIGKQKLLREA